MPLNYREQIAVDKDSLPITYQCYYGLFLLKQKVSEMAKQMVEISELTRE